MANYVFYESHARRRELARTKYRSYSGRGFETADEIFQRLVPSHPDLICVEENYGERVITGSAFGAPVDADTESEMRALPTPDDIVPVTPIDDDMRTVLGDTADSLIAAVRQMGIDGAADGMLYGTRGTPELLRHTGHQWESWITKDIARRCQFSGAAALPTDAVRRFHESPGGARGKNVQYCDIYCPVGGIPLWIECKSVFECVILKGALTHNGRTYARDYIDKPQRYLR
jgi:hypothetical protein